MSNPIRINEGQSKSGRDIVARARKLATEMGELKTDFAAMDQHKTVNGVLTTRTNTTSGTLTADVGHSIATGDIVTLFFAGGSRTSVVVGSVSGLSIPFSGGSGNDLPAQDAAVTVEHYRAIANLFGAVTESDAVSPAVAKILYDETNSAVNNSAALNQWIAKLARQ